MNLSGTSVYPDSLHRLVTAQAVLARTLHSLVLGFIVVLAVPASASDKIEKEPGFLYIASFNVFTLGAVEKRYRDITDDSDLHELDRHLPKRTSNLAHVLAVGGFDIVAIQEVRSGPAGRAVMEDLVSVLKDQHGLAYGYVLSEYIGDGFNEFREAIAFLYKPETAWPEPVDATGQYSTRIEIDGRDLVRTQWEAGHFDFTMYAAHLSYGNHDHRREGYEAIARIFEQASDTSADPDIIVLGDFNRLGRISLTCATGASGCKQRPPIKSLGYDALSPSFRAPNITAFDRAFSQCPQVNNCLNSGTPLPVEDPQLLSTTAGNNTYAYDTIMFSRDASEEFPRGLHEAKYGVDFGIIHFDHPTGFGFQPGADRLDQHCLKKTYSDHRPVWLRFRTDVPSFADD